MNAHRLLTALVIAATTALAAAAPSYAATQRITVYDSTQLALHRYTVVKRIGLEGWESAFRIRGHETLDAARQALLNEAARVGADGLINVTCFDQTDGMFKPQGYFCYGNAIRVKQ